MLYGLYLSGQGADVQSMRQDVIANNLANASTTAFKRSFVLAQAHHPFEAGTGEGPLPELADQTGGVSVVETPIDFAGGSFEKTEASLDLALAGPGFFRVNAGKEELLTRDGRLDIDAQGALVLREMGHPVLSPAGLPILVDPLAGPVSVGPDGSVSQQIAGQMNVVGQLDIVEPRNYLALERMGDLLYRGDGELVPAPPVTQIKQGHLETSGTQPIIEMVDLIQTSRAFEANVNMIKYQDETLGQLLGSLPRR